MLTSWGSNAGKCLIQKGKNSPLVDCVDLSMEKSILSAAQRKPVKLQKPERSPAILWMLPAVSPTHLA